MTTTLISPVDPEVTLLIPADDVADPEISIVIPALNESLTIDDFVAWCRQGLAAAGVKGEILIVDSSTDDTAHRAVAGGARVLRTPKRGLGNAYMDALAYVRGKFVIMGDADCTYDFRELKAFVDKFHEGHEFVMGSRWKGSIEPGSMPWLHRRLGTPITTWILNFLYSSDFSDIHCGMRGITTDALRRMDLQSRSWEYASEMVLKSVHMRLRTAEVPVLFLKDREGRLSHHKRAGWWSPFHAAWINLRAMFVYGADFFVFKPGLALLALGLLISVPLSLGPITIGRITFSVYWMLLGVSLALVGLQCFLLGCLAQVFFDYTGSARRRWLRVFRYTRTLVITAILFLVGVVAGGLLILDWVGNDYRLDPQSGRAHFAVFGLLLVVSSLMVFVNTLLLHAAALSSKHLIGVTPTAQPVVLNVKPKPPVPVGDNPWR